MKIAELIARRFSTKIVNSPKVFLTCAFILFFILAAGVFKIRSNFSVKMWLYEDDQRITQLADHEKTFGSSETMDVIIYREDGLFNKETIKIIQSISEEMTRIKDIVRVESITNLNWIETQDDDITIIPFLDEETDLSSENILLKKNQATTDAQIKNNFISSSGRLVYIRSFLKVYETNPPYNEIVTQVEKMLEKYKSQGLEFHLSGISYINESLSRASDRDMLLVFPIVVVILMLILLYFFKTPLGVIYPFSLIAVSIISAFGVEGYLGLPFNNILSAVPAVLIAIGLADSIHVMISYRHNVIFENQTNEQAAKNSLTKNFVPTILTTITTAIGFFSLTTADIVPISDLGLLSGIGTILAWVYTYLFLGPILKYMNFKKRPLTTKIKGIDLLYKFCSKYKLFINTLLPIFAITMVYFGTQNVINADPVEYFDNSTPIKKTFTKIEDEFGGSRAIELVFDSGEAEGIKDPIFLKRADELLTWLEAKPEVVKANSIIQIIKKMNQTLHSGKEEYYAIPDTRRAVSDQLFLYTLGLPQGVDLKNQMSLDNRRFKVLLTWNVNDTMTAIKKTDEILEKAKEIGVNVYEGGQSPIYNRVNDLVVKTFFTSMSLSIPLIFLIVLFVFKDLKLSLLSLIPNLFPLGVASGIMYFCGDELNIGNVIVFSVCLGIAVDDTIHFIANYKLKINKGMNNATALKATLEQTGKALILTTIMLCFGFGLFVLGEFIPNQKFGIYCAIILTLALVADLILLPSILLATQKDK